MHGWIVYPRYISLHSDNAFGWMRDEAARHGITLDIIFQEELAPVYSACGGSLFRNGTEVASLPDFVVLRGYDTILSLHLESLGIPVINSAAASAAAKDKLLTCQMLSGRGISVPATVGGTPEEWDYGTLSRLFGSGTFVVKRRDGAKGEDVYLVNTADEMAAAVNNCGGNCIAQQFVAGSAGRDVRVWVIGGEAAACVLRYSENSFLSNYSQGGKAAPYELTPGIRAIAEQSADILGLEFAGVDLLFGRDGFTVCEMNANAGFRTLSAATGRNDIPARLFAYIASKYGKSRRDGGRTAP